MTLRLALAEVVTMALWQGGELIVFEPDPRSERGFDPATLTGRDRPRRSAGTRKQLRACCLGVAVLLAGAALFALVLGLLTSR